MSSGLDKVETIHLAAIKGMLPSGDAGRDMLLCSQHNVQRPRQGKCDGMGPTRSPLPFRQFLLRRQDLALGRQGILPPCKIFPICIKYSLQRFYPAMIVENKKWEIMPGTFSFLNKSVYLIVVEISLGILYCNASYSSDLISVPLQLGWISIDRGCERGIASKRRDVVDLAA